MWVYKDVASHDKVSDKLSHHSSNLNVVIANKRCWSRGRLSLGNVSILRRTKAYSQVRPSNKFRTLKRSKVCLRSLAGTGSQGKLGCAAKVTDPGKGSDVAGFQSVGRMGRETDEHIFLCLKCSSEHPNIEHHRIHGPVMAKVRSPRGSRDPERHKV